jgi:hypothetical protein
MTFMTKTLCGFFLLCIALPTVAFGQDKPALKPRVAPPDSTAPVTQSEARATMAKVQASLSAVAGHSMSFAPSTIPDSSQPVTHEQVITEFDRLYKGAKPYFKFTPHPVWYDPSVFSVKSGSPARPMLELLVKQGFIPRVSLLATSKQDTMSIYDFGDTVGLFVARVADVCHLPSPKWSPNIEKP